MDQSVQEARAKLAARFGSSQIGGKGKYIILSNSFDSHISQFSFLCELLHILWLFKYWPIRSLWEYLIMILCLQFRNPKKNKEGRSQ